MLDGRWKQNPSSDWPDLPTLAPENGWAHIGGHGAGHYVKMVPTMALNTV